LPPPIQETNIFLQLCSNLPRIFLHTIFEEGWPRSYNPAQFDVKEKSAGPFPDFVLNHLMSPEF
jgi:hypothetical protein